MKIPKKSAQTIPCEKVDPIDILYLKTIYFIIFDSFPERALSISITVYWHDKLTFVYYLE